MDINGFCYRGRCVDVNTPERDETRYADATNANADLVDGQTVTLVRDSSNTDRYGRLLRYIYVGNVFVNAQLVQEGWAQSVECYNLPDTANAATFRQLEAARDAQPRLKKKNVTPPEFSTDGSTTRCHPSRFYLKRPGSGLAGVAPFLSTTSYPSL